MSLLRPRLIAGSVLIVAPFLIGATDPVGDVAPCQPGGGVVGGSAPDVVAATARGVEGGASLEVRVRFAERPDVPDTEGRPFRVDVVVLEPELPAYTFGYYNGVNRIVRYDAVASPHLEILLLPERGENQFFAVSWTRRTLVMRLPGRLLTRDEDLAGVNLGRLRWGVVVRDEAMCDSLREPHVRVSGNTRPPDTPTMTAIGSDSGDPAGPERAEPAPFLSREVLAAAVFLAGVIGVALLIITAGERPMRRLRR
jgi:hypothetical protein